MMNSDTSYTSEDLRVSLVGEVGRKFLEIKKAKGLHSNAETFRYIVTEFYESIAHKEAAR